MGKRLAPHELGFYAQRQCTDLCGIVSFGIFWLVMLALAGIAFKEGDLERMIYGTDYDGNVCGKTPAEKNSTYPPDMASRKYLWYPVTFNKVTKNFELASAIKMGLCVRECPLAGDIVETYGLNPKEDSVIPRQWTVAFNSSAMLRRCIPRFDTFVCPAEAEYSVTCKAIRLAQESKFKDLVGIHSLATGGFARLQKSYGVMALLALLAIILSFGWLIVLRRIVKPIVVITSLALVASGVVGGVILFKAHSDADKDSQAYTWYMVGAIGVWIATFIYTCLLVYLWRELMVSCDIIEEASRVPVAIPWMATVPLVSGIFILVLALFGAVVAISIHASGAITNDNIPAWLPNGTSTTARVATFTARNWRVLGQFYNLFVFLWTMGFINAIAYMVVALCGVLWYWSVPGEAKTPPTDAVSWSAKTTFQFHLGTLAFGAFLIAVVQWTRCVLRFLEHRFHKIKQSSNAVRFCLCVAECCLAYFERVVKFLSKNAYIVTAITGEPLLPAGRHALVLLVSNLAVAAVSWISEIVLVVGKLLVVGITTFVAWIWVDRNQDENENLFFVVVLVFFIAYFIASSFASVFSVCIDTVLLCYCYDHEINNGSDRPYYFPENLRKHVAKAHERHQDKLQQADTQGLVNNGDRRDYSTVK